MCMEEERGVCDVLQVVYRSGGSRFKADAG